MEKAGNLIKVVVVFFFVGGVFATIIDVISQKKAVAEAKQANLYIHKKTGIYERYLKRFFDFFLSGIAIFVLCPVLIVTAILVRIKLGSPVLFIQKRPGKNEKIFSIFKFRTMTDERDEDGELLPDEARLTSFGKMLRSTSLDEVPELFNILRGDMSIVGPRPLVQRYIPYYTSEEHHRHDVRSGLTGLAQINGRNELSWDKRLMLDVEYVKKISLYTDLSIILRTFRKVIKREDIVIRGIEGSVLDFDVERKLKMKNSSQEKEENS